MPPPKVTGKSVADATLPQVDAVTFIVAVADEPNVPLKVTVTLFALAVILLAAVDGVIAQV